MISFIPCPKAGSTIPIMISDRYLSASFLKGSGDGDPAPASLACLSQGSNSPYY